MFLGKLSNPDFSKRESYIMYLLLGLALGLMLALMFYAAPAMFGLMSIVGASGWAAYVTIVGITMLSTLGMGLLGSGLRDLKNMRYYKHLGPSNEHTDYLGMGYRPYAAIASAYLKVLMGIVLATPLIAMLMPKALVANLIVPFFQVSSKWLLLPIAMLMPVIVGGPLLLLSMLCRMGAKNLQERRAKYNKGWYVTVGTILSYTSNVLLIGGLASIIIFAWNPLFFTQIANHCLNGLGLPAVELDGLPLLGQAFATMAIAIGSSFVMYSFWFAWAQGQINAAHAEKEEAEQTTHVAFGVAESKDKQIEAQCRRIAQLEAELLEHGLPVPQYPDPAAGSVNAGPPPGEGSGLFGVHGYGVGEPMSVAESRL